MKKVILVSVILSVLFLSGCGSTMGYIGHSIDTKVVLSQANFKVIGSAQGATTAMYILGIGPSNAELYRKARNELVRNAKLTDGNKSRALINVTTDIKKKG
tara:strand:- start:39 stop:341 length:303 start_codon:yes stop_codon:yes gene_type:complete